MQITTDPKVTTTEAALAEFKEADALHKSAVAEVQRYRFEHPSLTKTVAFILLEAKCEELGRDRNAKLNRWSNLKPNTDTVSVPAEIKPVCAKCGSAALVVRLSGAWRCNGCGSQSVGE
jgi:hypothetical protein